MRGRAGFTLIEMLAVIAIFALMAALVGSNLGVVSRRALRNDAELLAAQLELARQRSVVTSQPHRLVLDLDEGTWQLESLAPAAAAPEAEPLDLGGGTPLPLDAAPVEAREYAPLPGQFGRITPLDDDVLFAAVQTPEGWIERGQAFVAFERDGTATYTVIVLTNDGGDTLELEVLPLADAVRVRDEAS